MRIREAERSRRETCDACLKDYMPVPLDNARGSEDPIPHNWHGFSDSPILSVGDLTTIDTPYSAAFSVSL